MVNYNSTNDELQNNFVNGSTLITINRVINSKIRVMINFQTSNSETNLSKGKNYQRFYIKMANVSLLLYRQYIPLFRIRQKYCYKYGLFNTFWTHWYLLESKKNFEPGDQGTFFV